jgi:hypothetical protein
MSPVRFGVTSQVRDGISRRSRGSRPLRMSPVRTQYLVQLGGFEPPDLLIHSQHQVIDFTTVVSNPILRHGKSSETADHF